MTNMNPATLSVLLGACGLPEDADSGALKANFIAATLPGGIEAQELAGQAISVHQANLPRKGCARHLLEQMGIKFGANVDNLFVTAQLPEGWTKKASDHSMWSYLIDDKGRRRASIFYKAAFYDEDANITLNGRYGLSCYEACDEHGNLVPHGQHTHLMTVVQDAGNNLHVVGIRKADDYTTSDVHRQEGQDFLDKHFPDWKNELAYWD